MPYCIYKLRWQRLILGGALVCAVLAAPTLAEPLRIAIVGDINGNYGSDEYPPLSLALRDKVLALKPNLVLSTGDVVAGQKRGLSQQNLQNMWHSFDRQFYQPASDAGIIWLPVIGNHDGSKAFSLVGSYLFATDRQQAATYWRSKQVSHAELRWLDKQHYPFYYSLLFADTALLVIDASGSELTSTELQWLEQQLRSPAFTQAANRIVAGHLPMFAIAKGREAPAERLAQSQTLLKLFNQYRVSWYISGHQHAYYVSKIQQLSLLMAGGIPARPLLGTDKRQSVFSVLSLLPSASIQSWDLHTNTEVTLEQLPESLPALPFAIQRWPASTTLPCNNINQQDALC
ncbi:metallophosphoesterase family protein [Rheinheimera maricola]|uniref:Metallophosphoesterase n=1 Tax=Rheinheimera maricola TaxID=2793282 RepID=A0ABS7X7R1_9GAMM|nr:metallophosphoesterase [Rheinheimera maricola]MBZ9611591.1 metallophosphoesterase [Rheinheimera maricola]